MKGARLGSFDWTGAMNEVQHCPACGTAVPITPDLAGMTIECPKCGATFEVPGEPSAGVAEDAFEKRPRPSSAPPGTPQRWDLPEASAGEPHVPMRDEKRSQFRTVVAIGIVVLVGLVSFLLARRLKRAGPAPLPGARMSAMNQDVLVGDVRCRVTAAEWRTETAAPSQALAQPVLDVHLSAANVADAPRMMPLLMLGDRWGKSLAAEFGTPVLLRPDDQPVTKLQAGETVRGHVVFQAQLGDYCLILSAGKAQAPPEIARIRLRARAISPAR